MNDTFFYIFGIALIVSAVVISLIGLRFENFPPSRGVLAGIVGYFAVLVGLTAYFAVLNAEDEQRATESERAAEAQTQAEEQAPAGGASQAATDAQGKQLFAANGCGSCHTLKAAGSTGTIGPDLDQGLKGKSASFIHTSIVDPNAEVTEGFPSGTMPQTFGKTMNPDQVDALVDFLMSSTSAKQ